MSNIKATLQEETRIHMQNIRKFGEVKKCHSLSENTAQDSVVQSPSCCGKVSSGTEKIFDISPGIWQQTQNEIITFERT